MEFLQAKQSRMHRERIQVLTPNRKNYVIKPVDMRLFLDRFPMIALPKQMCKPFYNIIKNFLVNHLYKFKTNKRLYSRPPFFPPEKDLPDVVNAFGPTEHLEKNYPHLARTKHDMVMNIMHFMVTYSLDWICEVLTLKHDSRGYVKYSCPILDLEPREMYNADNGHGHSPSGSALTDRPPRAESNLPPQQEREQTEHVPGTSRRDALPSMSDLPDPQQPDEQDDWRDLVNIAMNDPNLPMHYKTMIQCLVTSNRDLKKVIASLEHTR
ncbi:unnamed protein product [Nippostrongylus brasiliensis]|uniref:MADF domain-containing protein n=1 Tax=Nippostrongylus brasiliensis TaxID=27835 RepID=A0A0N4YYU2_NIPBR|nr:unnamed protein product [Nippostrongylus brasiliensis]